MIPIPSNYYTAGTRATASIGWQYAAYYTSSVTNNNPAFFVAINGANYLLVSGSVSTTVSGSFTCYQGDNVYFFVSGSTQSNRYTLSTLTVQTGSTILVDVQRTRSDPGATMYDYTGPLNATGSLTTLGNSVYNVTASNWSGVNPLCCVNLTTVNNVTYVYTDCAGNNQGITGGGLTVCARYGTMRNGPVIIGGNCGGTC
jgi:hypothetical protein